MFFIKKNKTTVFFFFLLLPLILFKTVPLYAQDKPSLKRVAVFGLPEDSPYTALSSEAVEYIKRVFNDCGRFLPADKAEAVFNELKKSAKEASADSSFYNKAAALLNADIYVVAAAYQVGNILYSDVNIFSINHDYKFLEKKLKFRSKVKLNIPLKIGREIAHLHTDLPVNASVVKSYDNGFYLIDAGEWHGLKSDSAYKMYGGDIRVIRAGRFESLVEITGKKKAGDSVIIKIFPDTGKILKALEEDISRNTVGRYALEIQGSAEKRLLQGICIINMGGNLCLPGYGAFLSTGYLGFKEAKPDWTGVALSSSSIGLQLLLPELLTGFDANFLPWVRDPDKNKGMQDCQTFLWATIPVTFSVAFMDQLAVQFSSTEHVPPFFQDKDNMAALFSVFLPGGGAYYKGHRLAGWSLYFSEMITAGYGIYNYDSDKGKRALYALGAIKIFDILYAYMAGPSYSFYNFEKEGNLEPAVKVGISQDPAGKNTVNLMVTSCF